MNTIIKIDKIDRVCRIIWQRELRRNWPHFVVVNRREPNNFGQGRLFDSRRIERHIRNTTLRVGGNQFETAAEQNTIAASRSERDDIIAVAQIRIRCIV